MGSTTRTRGTDRRIAAPDGGHGSTEEFRSRQARELPRAAAFGHDVDDPVRAQQNRLARDRLVAEDAVRKARDLDIRVIEVDGSLDAEGVAGIVAEQFGPYLA